MAYLVENLVNTLAGVLMGESGVEAVVGEPAYVSDAELREPHSVGIRKQALAADAAEGGQMKRAEIAVYCEKLRNTQREKFRAFSGTAQMVVDLRATGETAELTDGTLQKYVEGVLQVLQAHRGDWGGGLFFGGAYDVAFQPAKKGGKNYVQTARVTLPVDYSAN